MTERNKEIKRLAGFSIGPIVRTIIGIASVPVTTRLLVPDQFGVSAIYTTFLQVIYLIVSMSYEKAFIRFFVDENDEGKLTRHILIPPMVLWAVISLIIWIFRAPISDILFEQPEYNLLFWLILNMGFRFFNGIASAKIQMSDRPVLYSVTGIVRRFNLFLITVLLLVFYDRSFKSVIYGTMITEILQTILLAILTRKRWAIRGSIDMALLGRLTRYALPLGPSTISIWLYNATDKFVIRYFDDFESVGVYSGAFKIITILTIAISAVSSYWTPTVLGWYKSGIVRKRIDQVGTVIIYAISALTLIIIAAKDLLILYLGPEYHESIIFIPFLILVPLIKLMGMILNVGILLEKKSVFTLYKSLFTTFLNLILNVILIQTVGVIGCAIATAISTLAGAVISSIYSSRLNHNYLNIRHASTLAIVIICAVATSCISSHHVLFCFFSLLAITMINWKSMSLLLTIIRESLHSLRIKLTK